VNKCLQKAGGDVRKAGKLDPFAYVPLQHQYLNKRYINLISAEKELNDNYCMNICVVKLNDK